MIKSISVLICALETRLSLDVAIMWILELFLENQYISHSDFYLYWSFKIHNWNDIRVLIAVKKNFLYQVIIDNWTNLACLLYYSFLNIQKPQFFTY